MTNDLSKGSIFKNLIYFSLPYLMSCFLQNFYGLCDVFITGQYNGSATISAVTNGSQIMHMITVIIVGLAMGTTVMISQSVGSGDKKKVSSFIGNSATLFISFSIIVTVILLLCMDGIINVMHIPFEAISDAKEYLTICFIGIPVITAYNILSCVFRGLGDSKSPMYFVAVACVINVVLDYIFIGLMEKGATGAALATVLAQTISVVFALFYAKVKNKITLSKSDFVPDFIVFKKILQIGLPVSLQDGLIQVSFIIISIIANSRGVVISTSVGIVEKIICFLFLIPSAMLSSISAIAAQNIGAGKKDRAVEVLKLGTLIAIGFGIIFAVICQLASTEIIDLFSDDPDVIRLGAQYLRSYVFDCSLAGIHFCFSGFFCAYGKSLISFIHNIISIILVRVPGAYLASIYYPDTLFPMGLAAPLGSLLSALICIGFFIHLRKKQEI